MKNKMKTGILLAILAAALYALNAPLSKLLLAYMSPTLMAGFLYLGAGARRTRFGKEKKQKRTETCKKSRKRIVRNKHNLFLKKNVGIIVKTLDRHI